MTLPGLFPYNLWVPQRLKSVRSPRWMRRTVALAAVSPGQKGKATRLKSPKACFSQRWGNHWLVWNSPIFDPSCIIKMRETCDWPKNFIQPWIQCNGSYYSIRPQDDRPWSRTLIWVPKLELNFQLFRLKYNPSNWQNTWLFFLLSEASQT